jgi:ribonucleoside-diphosphate reductase alpha chain
MTRDIVASSPSRQRLPNRRPALTFSFEHEGLRYTATIGRYPDGRVAEVFVQNRKSNSSADTSARDCAIAISLALQHGADLETIRRSLCRNSRGRAASPVAAALDLIAEGGAQ